MHMEKTQKKRHTGPLEIFETEAWRRESKVKRWKNSTHEALYKRQQQQKYHHLLGEQKIATPPNAGLRHKLEALRKHLLSRLKLPPCWSSQFRLWLGLKTNSYGVQRATPLSPIWSCFLSTFATWSPLTCRRTLHCEAQMAKHRFKTYLTFHTPHPELLQNST